MKDILSLPTEDRDDLYRILNKLLRKNQLEPDWLSVGTLNKESSMYSTYKLNTDELSEDIMKSIKSAYPHKEIEIIVQDIQDETEYLLSTDSNKDHLLKAVKDINNKENLVSVKLEDL